MGNPNNNHLHPDQILCRPPSTLKHETLCTAKLSAKDDAGHLGRDVARAYVLGVYAVSPDDLRLRSALVSVWVWGSGVLENQGAK